MRISDWSSDVCSSDLLAQYPHRDHDLWPAIKSGQQFQINVMWPLSPFTAENGATRLWPGSHRLGYDGDTSESVAVPAVCQPEIGRASCRERVCQTCRSRWSPYH